MYEARVRSEMFTDFSSKGLKRQGLVNVYIVYTPALLVS
jgi:hypothetical protein